MKQKLRIGMLASNYLRIPPEPAEKYLAPGTSGAVEIIVHTLTEELVRRGHDVTLFASGDSATTARLVNVTPTATWSTIGQGPHHQYEQLLISQAYQYAKRGEFDLLHTHFDLESIHFAPLVDTPTVKTVHSQLKGLDREILSQYKTAAYYISISNSQRHGLPDLQYVGTAYNGLNVENFPFAEKKEDYLIHVGRIMPEKGAAEAIELAKRTNHRLLLFGSVNPALDYWEKQVKPHIDNKQIVYMGTVSREKLFTYFTKAKAFIFPLQWEEPFGLAVIEAMACGTPVIALRRGAMPEVISEGKSGFVVDTIDEMVEALDKVSTIDPHACRRHVAENFSIEKMVDQYLEAYAAALERHKA